MGALHAKPRFDLRPALPDGFLRFRRFSRTMRLMGMLYSIVLQEEIADFLYAS